jgi:hypothetical protein
MLIGVVGATLLFSACSDNPAETKPGAGDPENISRITITLTPAGGGTPLASVIVDPDGTTLPESPEPPTATLTLAKGVTYNGTIDLKNDIGTPVVEISDEVEEEKNFHRFFYSVFAASSDSLPIDEWGQPNPAAIGVTIPLESLNLDAQSPAQVFGSQFQVVVAADAPTTASALLKVQLHHFEDEKGDGLGTTYDTDLNVNFPISVQ